MKIKHYSLFNQPITALTTSEAWDVLRNDSSDLNFYLPETLEMYEKNHVVKEAGPMAKWIIDCASTYDAQEVFSVGCGIAYLEYEIKKYSNLKVTVTDYADSILKLKRFNIFDDAYKFDVFNDPLSLTSNSIFLMPRVDTEFSNEQLVSILQKCHAQNIQHICFIPAQLLSVRIVLSVIKLTLKSLLLNKKRVFCGYSRSKSEFKKIFSTYYSAQAVHVNAKTVFLLTRK